MPRDVSKSELNAADVRAGKLLGKLRAAAGLSLSEAAAKIAATGVRRLSRQNLHQYEMGFRRPPPEVLVVVARVYGVSVGELGGAWLKSFAGR